MQYHDEEMLEERIVYKTKDGPFRNFYVMDLLAYVKEFMSFL